MIRVIGLMAALVLATPPALAADNGQTPRHRPAAIPDATPGAFDFSPTTRVERPALGDLISDIAVEIARDGIKDLGTDIRAGLEAIDPPATVQ